MAFNLPKSTEKWPSDIRVLVEIGMAKIKISLNFFNYSSRLMCPWSIYKQKSSLEGHRVLH